jgi:DNA-binding MarR family transcriptional regulator
MNVVTELSIGESIEQIIVAGVALTTLAINAARPGFDLTFPQWRVLVILGGSPDGARISDVAQRVGVTLPATSRQLRRLERRGLLVVSPDGRDRRASLVRLTEEGRAAHDAILSRRRSRVAEIVAGFESDVTLRAQMRALAEAFSPIG